MPLYSADTIPLHSAIPPYASPFSLIPFFLLLPSFSRPPSPAPPFPAPPSLALLLLPLLFPLVRPLPVRPSAIPLSPVQRASALCFPLPSLVPVPSIRIMIICKKIYIILS